MREETSRSVQEVSHAEMQSRFAEVKIISRFAPAEVMTHRRKWKLCERKPAGVEMVLYACEQQQRNGQGQGEGRTK